MHSRLVFLAAASIALAACSSSKAPEDPTGLGPRGRTTPDLQAFPSCQALVEALRANLTEEMRAQVLSRSGFGGPGVFTDTGIGVVFDQSAAEEGGDLVEGVDFTGTNNQEAGVDEPDFVKTDGSHFWVLNGNRLEVLSAPTFGELEAISSTPLDGQPFALLQVDEQLVVLARLSPNELAEDHPLFEEFGQDFGGEFDGGFDVALGAPFVRNDGLVKLTLLDVSAPETPRIERELWIEGHFRTGRRVEGSIRLVTWSRMNLPGLRLSPEFPDGFFDVAVTDVQRAAMLAEAERAAIAGNDALIAAAELEDFLPRIVEPSGTGFVEHSLSRAGCADFTMPVDGTGRSVTSILTLDLARPDLALDADHLVGNASVVYSSVDTMIVAEPANDEWWFFDNATGFEEATNLHRFDVSVPGETSYTGSGRVDGYLESSFALSEHEGFVRAATMTGRRFFAPGGELETNVFVLAGEQALEVVGQVGGIAPGERLWAARFVGDRGFLVTFRNIDPLWTLDLSDPTDPRIAGELEVPGVSTYIHPIEGDHLLTVGRGGDGFGLNGSTQISLFDVTTFDAPQIDDVLPLGLHGTDFEWVDAWSEALHDPKAFQYFAPANMLAVPMTGRLFFEPFSSTLPVSLLELIAVELPGTLRHHGAVDHSEFYAGQALFDSRGDIRRSFFLGDFIYAFSDRGVTAHRLDDLSQTAAVALPGS